MAFRHLDEAELIRLIGWNADVVDQLSSGEKLPTLSQLDALSSLLAVYSNTWFDKRELKFKNVPVNFKTERNKEAKLSLKTRRLLDTALAKAKFANRYSVSNRQFKPFGNFTLESSVNEFGKLLRSHLKITDQLQQQYTAGKFYNYLSDVIQNYGVYIFGKDGPTEEFRGFTSNLRPFPLIVINTSILSKKAQIFTLVHEYVHLLIGETGISDPYATRNRVERFCNSVAAIALAPKRLVEKIAATNKYSKSDKFEFLRYFSNKLNLSLQCVLIRLIKLKIVASDFLPSAARNAYFQLTDFKSDGGGGSKDQDYDYGQMQLWRYGHKFIAELTKALEVSKISLIDVEDKISVSEENFISLAKFASGRASDPGLEGIVIDSFSVPGFEYEISGA